MNDSSFQTRLLWISPLTLPKVGRVLRQNWVNQRSGVGEQKQISKIFDFYTYSQPVIILAMLWYCKALRVYRQEKSIVNYKTRKCLNALFHRRTFVKTSRTACFTLHLTSSSKLGLDRQSMIIPKPTFFWTKFCFKAVSK